MFKRILIPLDGSPLAEKVLPFTLTLAEKFQATLILFHVVEKSAPSEIHGQHHLHEFSEAKDYLNGVAAKFATSSVPILTDVHEVQEVGVAQTICGHAIELQSDLVVLCAHGNGGLRDMFFGSIAQQVIRQGSIPVLFIRPETMAEERTNPIQRILVPLDGSAAHEVALPVAAHLAKIFAAQIHLFTVIPSADTLPIKDAISSRVSPRMTNLTLDIQARQAEEYLKLQSQEFHEQRLKTSITVLQGDALLKLLEVIALEKIDLVIMATHGHNVIDSHWEGSLTPRFLQKTPLPVILVRGTAE